jgi:hypothetical protein
MFISGTGKSLFSGSMYIFGTSKGLLSDYMNLFWSTAGACGETKAELKNLEYTSKKSVLIQLPATGVLIQTPKSNDLLSVTEQKT